MLGIKRREFIAVLGGAAAWPLAVRAQQGDRVRRIGVLMQYDENDPVWKPYLSAFTQALADLGWTDGRNVRMDLRWGGGDINRIQALARELVGLQPDIIVTGSTPATVAVRRETRTIPIVFVGVGDPVASGIVHCPAALRNLGPLRRRVYGRDGSSTGMLRASISRPFPVAKADAAGPCRAPWGAADWRGWPNVRLP
jgi:hypothetical protein